MKENWKKNIVLFLTSQTISLFGTSLVQYAIMWYITLTTQSGIMMTISIVCGFVPIFFISPFGGVWADRYDKKVLIMLSDSMIAFFTLILAILFFMGYHAIWLLFAFSAIRALGSGIQTPAVGSLIPQLIPEEKLMKVNGINGSIQSAIMLISPMISGALLTVASIEIIFFIDIVTAIIGVLTLLLFLKIKSNNNISNNKVNSYFDEMKNGLIYINNHEYVKRFFLFCTLFVFLAVPVAFLTPLQVTRNFGNDVWRLTAIEVTFSAGMIIGGIAMASWGGFKNKVITMTMASLLIGICTLTFGFITNFWIYLFVMGITGLTMPLFNTPSMVLLQEKVEDNYLGRVFGVMSMISSFVMPLGMLIFGPLADVVRIEYLLIITGILLFIIGLFMFSNKVLIEAGRTVVKSE